MKSFKVRAPATSANLGPGFDCLGLALALWNETVISFGTQFSEITISGEGEGFIPLDEQNLVLRSINEIFKVVGEPQPPNITISCRNRIPIGTGLGSSAAAILTGLLGANQYLGSPLDEDALLSLGSAMEGHPDNLCAAYYGGLVVSILANERVISRQFQTAQLKAMLVLPEVSLFTNTSRAALPERIPHRDAVFNLGRALLVVDAFRNGDLDQLFHAIEDRLHQPYRLPLIPGSAEAMSAARAKNIPAAISGAGAALIAFSDEELESAEEIQIAFKREGIESSVIHLTTSAEGASCSPASILSFTGREECEDLKI